jgi:Domain of unknown function (DUF4386)
MKIRLCWSQERKVRLPGMWITSGCLLIRDEHFHFGILIHRSGFLPRILGILLIAAGFGYLADSITPLLLPSYANVVDRFASIPLTLGEPAIILWFLIMGAKDQPLEAAA